MDKSLLYTLDEQVQVGFTGRVNVLDINSKQLYGNISLFEGEIIHCTFKAMAGLKGFYSIIVAEYENKKFDYIVEPEVIDESQRNIFYPFNHLKGKVSDVVSNYEQSKSLRPPANLKLVVNSNFVADGDEVTAQEYELLNTISDYSKVDEIYKNSSLLDYEITNALVSLRKKQAIKVIKNIGN